MNWIKNWIKKYLGWGDFTPVLITIGVFYILLALNIIQL